MIGATVTYYCVTAERKADVTNISGPVLGHFGTEEEFMSVAVARRLQSELRDAGVGESFRFYSGGHAFFNDTSRLGTYSPEAASTSWERTVAFLRQHLIASIA